MKKTVVTESYPTKTVTYTIEPLASDTIYDCAIHFLNGLAGRQAHFIVSTDDPAMSPYFFCKECREGWFGKLEETIVEKPPHELHQYSMQERDN